MTQIRAWDEEAAAADLLIAVLGGRSERRDHPGAADGTYDLDVWTDDGTHLAVEVTQEISFQLRQQYAEETKSTFESAELNGSWTVSIRGVVNLKRLWNALTPLLASLERAGLDKIYISGPGPHTSSEIPWAELGVSYAVRIATRNPGQIFLSTAGSVGTASPEVIARTAEDHASRPDNVAKLERATAADERHLFIWVDTTIPHASVPISLGLIPTRPIQLPEFIDSIWLAPSYENPRLLRFDRANGWRFVRVASLADSG